MIEVGALVAHLFDPVEPAERLGDDRALVWVLEVHPVGLVQLLGSHVLGDRVALELLLKLGVGICVVLKVELFNVGLDGRRVKAGLDRCLLRRR